MADNQLVLADRRPYPGLPLKMDPEFVFSLYDNQRREMQAEFGNQLSQICGVLVESNKALVQGFNTAMEKGKEERDHSHKLIGGLIITIVVIASGRIAMEAFSAWAFRQ